MSVIHCNRNKSQQSRYVGTQEDNAAEQNLHFFVSAENVQHGKKQDADVAVIRSGKNGEDTGNQYTEKLAEPLLHGGFGGKFRRLEPLHSI